MFLRKRNCLYSAALLRMTNDLQQLNVIIFICWSLGDFFALFFICRTNSGPTGDLWVQSLSVLDNALQLSYVISTRIQGIEAELLLYKGTISWHLLYFERQTSVTISVFLN